MKLGFVALLGLALSGILTGCASTCREVCDGIDENSYDCHQAMEACEHAKEIPCNADNCGKQP